MQHNHSFYLALGYGLSALVVIIEIASVWLAARKRKQQAAQFKDPL